MRSSVTSVLADVTPGQRYPSPSGAPDSRYALTVLSVLLEQGNTRSISPTTRNQRVARWIRRERAAACWADKVTASTFALRHADRHRTIEPAGASPAERATSMASCHQAYVIQC